MRLNPVELLRNEQARYEQAVAEQARLEAYRQRQEQDQEERARRQEAVEAERDAGLGLIGAIPRHLRSLAQQTALEREEKLRPLREAGSERELFKRQHQAEIGENPLKYWREEAARLNALAADESLSPALRQAAGNKAAELAANADRNDYLGGRIEEARSPETKVAEADAARRRKYEDTILAANEKDQVEGLDNLAGDIAARRVDEARAGLGISGNVAPPRPGGGMQVGPVAGVAPERVEPDRTVTGRGLGLPVGGASSAQPAAKPVGGASEVRPVARPAAASTVSPATVSPAAATQAPAGVAVPAAGTDDDLEALAAKYAPFAAPGGTDMPPLPEVSLMDALRPVGEDIGQALRPVAAGLGRAAGAAWDFLKPDVQAAQGGLDWAVNRPQTPADPAFTRAARGLGEALATVPTDDLGGGDALVRALSRVGRPVVDVASQVVTNADRAVRGLPTYVEDRPASAPGLGLTPGNATATGFTPDEQRRRRVGGY